MDTWPSRLYVLSDFLMSDLFCFYNHESLQSSKFTTKQIGELKNVVLCVCVRESVTPGVLVGLASELDQSVELGVPEEGTCRGLIELLRALRRELGVDGALREAAVGPSRPEI